MPRSARKPLSLEKFMSKLEKLRKTSTKPELASILGVNASFLTRCLYMQKPETQYHRFEIDKKSGGKRIIDAPSDELKSLQKKLSNLLLDCIDEINSLKFPDSYLAKPKTRSNGELDFAAKILKIKIPSSESKQPSLSHGFVRKRSIITNAMMHYGKKNVLNLDLEDFFGCFNFGRVRGFFIKNKEFKLNEHIATVIAQIACYKNKLPQGSPCSPVISNLITHSLDIRLASLAKRNKCTYTRYADDITFSTREAVFPIAIMNEEIGEYIPSKKLCQEITRAGFTINNKKTRIQYKNSRQEVTGLIVNKKPNIKCEYWRLARAKCNSLFKTGKFTIIKNGEKTEGNLNELEGQLRFIDQIDLYNRLRQKPPLDPAYALKNIGKNTKNLLTGRERVFSQFLYYRMFRGNEKPTILCEGKTDNIYLKCAISELKSDYPELAIDNSGKYELLLRFVEYTRRTRFLLEIFGGADYLKGFIDCFEKNSKLYKNVKPTNPVIIFLDNDEGPKLIVNALKSKNITLFPAGLSPETDIRKAEFIHITQNLYVIFTPLGPNSQQTDIEYFFDQKTRLLKNQNGKYFNTISQRDSSKDLSKDAFALLVKEHKKTIDFHGFNPLLNAIQSVIKHFKSVS